MLKKTYWQISAGSDKLARNYSDIFLKYGIAFVGHGDKKHFVEKIKPGHLVALKNGLSQIIAAGEVVERNGKSIGFQDKSWLLDFDGWDLSAYFYVEWHKPDNPIVTDGLAIAAINEIQQEKHKQIIEETLKLTPILIYPEPEETLLINDDDLLSFLIAKGLRPSSADELTNTIRKIRLLAKYYYNNCNWNDIREHETRTFLVVPLLLALGWSEQQIKIELPCKKGKVDIACFSGVFEGDFKKCELIIETKDFSKGLDYADEQAKRYSEEFPNCKGVLVTNGYCYKLFLRNEQRLFNKNPTAYLNLIQPRNRYPLDPMNVGGALEVLAYLLPN